MGIDSGDGAIGLISMGFTAVIILVALLVLGLILAKLYKRASKEMAFVRTGFGGQKVIVDGGSLVLPVLHEIIPVNMNTLRLEVRRSEAGALITKDRMRVDVTAEFYVRVKPTKEAIADSAQTLGRRTLDPQALRELVEGKFVDALRAVAAEMSMEELHEQRVQFVQKVQAAVSEDLLKNGLELESVSLTALDQTDRDFFNPQNAFDAQGLTRLTEEIEERRKQRNDIEQDTQVAVQQKNLDAERLKLHIAREDEYARLTQQQEVKVRQAQQEAEIASEQATQQRNAKQAEIVAKRETEESRIEADLTLETQRIEMQRDVAESDINRTRTIETADVKKEGAIALADQGRQIAIANKSREQSTAEAEADRARALAAEAQEAVVTVREQAQAERQKLIELVEARKQAERQAISVTVAAQAEKQAAEDRAEAVRTLADGHAGETRIAAEAAADAERLSAEAAGVRYTVDADGKRALNEAENLLSPDIVAMRIKLALIEHMDEIIRESVRPIEAIDGIKIVHVEGLSGNGHGNGHADGGPGGGGNLADAAVAAALRYRAQAPIVDSLLGEIGMASGDLNDITRPLREPTAMQPPAATAAVETAAAAVPDATGNGREAPAETPATSAATNGDGDSTGDDTEDDAESRPSAAE